MELEHAIGCNVRFTDVAHFHPNGTHWVYAIGAQVVASAVNDAHDQRFFNGHDDFVCSLAVSHNGSLVCSGQQGANADVCLWEYHSGKLKFRWQEHDFGIERVGFAHDDTLVVSCGFLADARMFVWNCDSGLIMAWVNLQPNPTVSCIQQGRWVKDIKRRDTPLYQFAVCSARVINLWHVDVHNGAITANPVHAADKTKREYMCCVFSKDHEYLYAATTTGDIACISMKNRVIQRFVTALNNISSVRTMVNISNSDNEMLLVGGNSGALTLFQGRTYADLIDTDQIKLGAALSSLSVNTAEDEVVVTTVTGSLFRVKPKRLAFTCPYQHPAAALNHVSFPFGSSDHMLTCSEDSCVVLWDLNDYSARTVCTERGSSIPNCAVGSADIIVAGYQDARIKCYESTRGDPLWRIDNAHKGGVSSINLARNMRFVVTGGVEGEIRVWEIKTKELIAHLKEHAARVNQMHLFTNDQYAISCSRDRCLYTWDLRAERRLTVHREKHGGINGIALAQDQTTVVSVGQEKTVCFWDLRVADCVKTIETDEEILCIDLSRNNNTFATGGTGQVVKLWDYRQCSPIGTAGNIPAKGGSEREPIMGCTGHSRDITSIKYAEDDKQCVSVSKDNSILVWNVY